MPGTVLSFRLGKAVIPSFMNTLNLVAPKTNSPQHFGTLRLSARGASRAAGSRKVQHRLAAAMGTDLRYMPLSGQPSVTSSTAKGACQLSSLGSCSLKNAVSAACDGLYLGSIFSIACTLHTVMRCHKTAPPQWHRENKARWKFGSITSVEAQEPSSGAASMPSTSLSVAPAVPESATSNTQHNSAVLHNML